MMPFWEWLNHIDKTIFKAINSSGAVPALDGIISLLRNLYTWIPLYLILVYWLFRYHRQYAWQFLFLSLLCFGFTDMISARLLKPLFGRLRPCHDPDLVSVVRMVIPCAGKYSMPSTHAFNHFGMAALWFFSVKQMSGRKWYWLFFWGLIIGYAQVYVGKHYPFDIVVGSMMGLFTGYLFALIFKRWCFADQPVKQREESK